MLNARFFLAITCAVSLSAVFQQAFALSDADQLQRNKQLQAAITSGISEYRHQIRPLLTDRQRAIEASIVYSVVISEEVNAAAYIDHGERRIDVSTTLMLLFDWLASANVLERRHPACIATYEQWLFTTIVGDLATTSRQNKNVAYSPTRYASEYGANCVGVKESEIETPVAVHSRLVATGASLCWTLSHELAHHLNGDTDRHLQDSSFPLEESRERERNADKFAFFVLERPGYNPLLAMPAYTTVSVLGTSVEGESASDHPSGPWRMRYLVDALETEMRDPVFQANVSKSGNSASVRGAARCLHAWAYQGSDATERDLNIACSLQ